MNNEQKYNALLLELAALLETKNTKISLLEWQVKALEGQLKLAEDELALAKGNTQAVDPEYLPFGTEAESR